MIAGDLRGMLVRRQGKSNFKARRNPLGTRHGDEQRMKVGAVALLGIAGIEHIAVSPARAGLVVAHGGEHVIVDGACLLERRGLAFGHFHRQVGRQSGDRDQFVRLQVFLAVTLLELNFGQTWSGYAQRQALVAHHVVDDFEMQAPATCAFELSA